MFLFANGKEGFSFAFIFHSHFQFKAALFIYENSAFNECEESGKKNLDGSKIVKYKKLSTNLSSFWMDGVESALINSKQQQQQTRTHGTEMEKGGEEESITKEGKSYLLAKLGDGHWRLALVAWRHGPALQPTVC